MEADQQATEEITLTKKDIEFIADYIERRLKKLQRRIEWSIFGAVLFLLIVAAPEFLEALIRGVGNAIGTLIAIVILIFEQAANS